MVDFITLTLARSRNLRPFGRMITVGFGWKLDQSPIHQSIAGMLLHLAVFCKIFSRSIDLYTRYRKIDLSIFRDRALYRNSSPFLRRSDLVFGPSSPRTKKILTAMSVPYLAGRQNRKIDRSKFETSISIHDHFLTFIPKRCINERAF